MYIFHFTHAQSSSHLNNTYQVSPIRRTRWNADAGQNHFILYYCFYDKVEKLSCDSLNKLKTRTTGKPDDKLIATCMTPCICLILIARCLLENVEW